MKSALVALAEYDATWPAKFAVEKAHLLAIASGWNLGGVEHVGSTAVPGMLAKPVIDIMFGIKTLDDAKPAIKVLEQYGYQYWPYKTAVMHWFCKPNAAVRTHHLHLVPFESALWHERIKFREILRSNPAIAAQYATLKRELAAAYPDDREAYTQQKWPFIQQILQRAEFSHSHAGVLEPNAQAVVN